MSPLSRQWSLRRSGGTTDGGASRIKECFRLHLNAVVSGVTIVQVCVVNHTDAANYRPPHMHLQILFSDSSRSQWVQLNQVTLPQLQQTLAELPAAPNGQQPQLHLHEAEPVSQGVERAVQERLPRHELTAAEAEMWADSGRQCPICLGDYSAGDVVTCLPCSGGHTSHISCLMPWLETASTCPMCRKNLPTAKDRNLDALMEDAERQLKDLLATNDEDCDGDELPTCETCEADPLELRTPDGKERLDLGAPGSSIDDEQGSSAGDLDQPPPSYMLADDVDASTAGLSDGTEALARRSVESGEALGGEVGSSGRGRRSGGARRSLVSRVSHAFTSKGRVSASR